MAMETLFRQIALVSDNPQELARLQAQIETQIESLTATIKARLTAATVGALLLDLTHREVRRLSDPTEMEISDFTGQARFLRALCAAVPLDSFAPLEDPQTDDLLGLCDTTWQYLSYREMLEGLKTHGQNPRAMFAGMMSLVSAIQGDLMSDDDCNQRIRRLFGPFSTDVIVPQLGVAVDEAIRGFTGVLEILKGRMERTFDLMRPVLEMWKKFKDLENSGNELPSAEEYAKLNPNMQNAFELFKQGVEIDRSLLVYQPSDLNEYVNGKGHEFLEAFSFTPGTVNQELMTLFNDDAVRSCPFGRMPGKKYLLFNAIHCTFAPLHRFLECFKTEKQRQRLLKNRDSSLEQEAVRLFSDVLVPEQQFAEYYLPLGPNGELHERDLLIIKDGVALIIESKARALRSVSDHRGNIRKIEKDVKSSIEKGYLQAISVIKHLRGATGPVAIYGSDKPGAPPIGEINLESVTTFVPVVFLDSYFGLISTNLEPWLTPTETEGYPWVVDCDALTAIVSLINTHSQLIEFIRWRRQLHGVAVSEDETVYAGFFLRHGSVAMPKGDVLVNLDPNYSNIFDKDYLRRMGAQIEEEEIIVGPPSWSVMKLQDDDVSLTMNGNIVDATGRHSRPLGKHRPTRSQTRRGKVGRNSPCSCGSGKKYKKCCGAS